jgi:cardiolipin synthase
VDWNSLQSFNYWPHLFGLLTIGVQAFAAGHALLNKRDVRSAIGWVGLIWLTPLLGAALYAMLGVNRIRRRARSLRADVPSAAARARSHLVVADSLEQALGPQGSHLGKLAHLVHEVTGLQLVSGNRVEPLEHGSRAYPEMLAAIAQAQRSILLTTYIFNYDAQGRQFIDALAAAVARGVQVRVLIDAVGSRYSWPSAVGPLRKAGVKVARFLPVYLPVFVPYWNLRSHRKILVIDGVLGFTGGMNIRDCGGGSEPESHDMNDLHFRVEGPVVEHLSHVAADDWEFASDETLDGELWFPPIEARGTTLARGVQDGPDENRDRLRMTILGGITCAQRSVQVVTPYFLPDAAIITALGVARMRGVEVDILLPENNNLAAVQWACTAQLWQVLEHGCRVWYTPGPFDHSKLMLVDGCWTLMGSGNWDARSLRLNFEFNVECYDAALAAQLEKIVARKLRVARLVSLAEVDGRKLPVRLRDGIARLFTPYL